MKKNLENGFDHYLRCWVKNGIVQNCKHPRPVMGEKDCNCLAREYCGKSISDARKREGLPKVRRNRIKKMLKRILLYFIGKNM